MGIILWLVFGAIAGWLASLIMKTDGQQGALGNIIVGIIGAVLGGFIMSMVGESGVNGFNIYSLLVAIGGAIVLLWLVRMFRGRAA
ncbi:GlsB/YeaQ/YmgE family stress response membrane protein [bacterium]|nr:MAG: GlsB/YeaQ/YmgE family stress response membrane protein [bacterium]